MRLAPFAFVAVSISAAPSSWACWDEAAQRYGVSSQLLYAMARVESNLNPNAVNVSHRQRTGSYDIGLMQINSSNLPALARHGIFERDLYDPCTSIHVGAWLLAHAFARHGGGWEGVGAYNAACTQLKGAACQAARGRYAWLVYRRLPATGVASGVPHGVGNRSATSTVVAPFIESATPILTARVSP